MTTPIPPSGGSEPVSGPLPPPIESPTSSGSAESSGSIAPAEGSAELTALPGAEAPALDSPGISIKEYMTILSDVASTLRDLSQLIMRESGSKTLEALLAELQDRIAYLVRLVNDSDGDGLVSGEQNDGSRGADNNSEEPVPPGQETGGGDGSTEDPGGFSVRDTGLRGEDTLPSRADTGLRADSDAVGNVDYSDPVAALERSLEQMAQLIDSLFNKEAGADELSAAQLGDLNPLFKDELLTDQGLQADIRSGGGRPSAGIINTGATDPIKSLLSDPDRLGPVLDKAITSPDFAKLLIGTLQASTFSAGLGSLEDLIQPDSNVPQSSFLGLPDDDQAKQPVTLTEADLKAIVGEDAALNLLKAAGSGLPTDEALLQLLVDNKDLSFEELQELVSVLRTLQSLIAGLLAGTIVTLTDKDPDKAYLEAAIQRAQELNTEVTEERAENRAEAKKVQLESNREISQEGKEKAKEVVEQVFDLFESTGLNRRPEFRPIVEKLEVLAPKQDLFLAALEKLSVSPEQLTALLGSPDTVNLLIGLAGPKPELAAFADSLKALVSSGLEGVAVPAELVKAIADNPDAFLQKLEEAGFDSADISRILQSPASLEAFIVKLTSGEGGAAQLAAALKALGVQSEGLVQKLQEAGFAGEDVSKILKDPASLEAFLTEITGTKEGAAQLLAALKALGISSEALAQALQAPPSLEALLTDLLGSKEGAARLAAALKALGAQSEGLTQKLEEAGFAGEDVSKILKDPAPLEAFLTEITGTKEGATRLVTALNQLGVQADAFSKQPKEAGVGSGEVSRIEQDPTAIVPFLNDLAKAKEGPAKLVATLQALGIQGDTLAQKLQETRLESKDVPQALQDPASSEALLADLVSTKEGAAKLLATLKSLDIKENPAIQAFLQKLDTATAPTELPLPNNIPADVILPLITDQQGGAQLLQLIKSLGLDQEPSFREFTQNLEGLTTKPDLVLLSAPDQFVAELAKSKEGLQELVDILRTQELPESVQPFLAAVETAIASDSFSDLEELGLPPEILERVSSDPKAAKALSNLLKTQGFESKPEFTPLIQNLDTLSVKESPVLTVPPALLPTIPSLERFVELLDKQGLSTEFTPLVRELESAIEQEDVGFAKDFAVPAKVLERLIDDPKGAKELISLLESVEPQPKAQEFIGKLEGAARTVEPSEVTVPPKLVEALISDTDRAQQFIDLFESLAPPADIQAFIRSVEALISAGNRIDVDLSKVTIPPDLLKVLAGDREDVKQLIGVLEKSGPEFKPLIAELKAAASAEPFALPDLRGVTIPPDLFKDLQGDNELIRLAENLIRLSTPESSLFLGLTEEEKATVEAFGNEPQLLSQVASQLQGDETAKPILDLVKNALGSLPDSPPFVDDKGQVAQLDLGSDALQTLALNLLAQDASQFDLTAGLSEESVAKIREKLGITEPINTVDGKVDQAAVASSTIDRKSQLLQLFTATQNARELPPIPASELNSKDLVQLTESLISSQNQPLVPASFLEGVSLEAKQVVIEVLQDRGIDLFDPNISLVQLAKAKGLLIDFVAKEIPNRQLSEPKLESQVAVISETTPRPTTALPVNDSDLEKLAQNVLQESEDLLEGLSVGAKVQLAPILDLLPPDNTRPLVSLLIDNFTARSLDFTPDFQPSYTQLVDQKRDSLPIYPPDLQVFAENVIAGRENLFEGLSPEAKEAVTQQLVELAVVPTDKEIDSSDVRDASPLVLNFLIQQFEATNLNIISPDLFAGIEKTATRAATPIPIPFNIEKISDSGLAALVDNLVRDVPAKEIFNGVDSKELPVVAKVLRSLDILPPAEPGERVTVGQLRNATSGGRSEVIDLFEKLAKSPEFSEAFPETLTAIERGEVRVETTEIRETALSNQDLRQLIVNLSRPDASAETVLDGVSAGGVEALAQDLLRAGWVNPKEAGIPVDTRGTSARPPEVKEVLIEHFAEITETEQFAEFAETMTENFEAFHAETNDLDNWLLKLLLPGMFFIREFSIQSAQGLHSLNQPGQL